MSNNTKTPETAGQEIKPKTIELIIQEISAQIYEVEHSVIRLAGIQERLQGTEPVTSAEDICDPSTDHLAMLNNQIERFRIANRSAESLISNIETIL